MTPAAPSIHIPPPEAICANCAAVRPMVLATIDEVWCGMRVKTYGHKCTVCGEIQFDEARDGMILRVATSSDPLQEIQAELNRRNVATAIELGWLTVDAADAATEPRIRLKAKEE